MDTKDENRVEHIEGSHDRSNSEDLEANGPGEMLRAHWKVCLYCICMSSGPLLYGFGLVSVGIVTSLPWFQSVTFLLFVSCVRQYKQLNST